MKKTKISKRTREYFSKNLSIKENRCGNNVKIIFDPSSGGIGIRLNKAKTIFSRTIEESKEMKVSLNIPVIKETRITTPKNRAIKILANIPAEATHTVPHFLSLKLAGLYGTGFAQPTKNEALVKTRISGRTTDPNQSKCFNGLKVSLPAYSAVLSPKYKAAYP